MFGLLQMKRSGRASHLPAKTLLAGALLLGWSAASSSAITVTASAAQSPNLPANVLDGDLNTRWSAFGDPQWIQFDLLSIQTVTAVDIAFFVGNLRSAFFDIETSIDATNWTPAYTGSSSGSTLDLERYDIVDVQARYVRIIGHGNTSNLWNSITEVDIDAFSLSVSASSFQAPNAPANTLDNDLATRWSAQGLGESIVFDFGSNRFISSLGVAFFLGNQRNTFFDIEVSADSVNWLPVHSVVSSGDSTEVERFSFPETSGRYVRLVGQGNTQNIWNSYTEVELSNPTPTWASTLGPNGKANAVASLPNGEFVVVGDLPGSTAIAGRYDNLGAEQYLINDNDPELAPPHLVTTDANENIVFVRLRTPPNFEEDFSDLDVVVTQANGSGSIQWNRTLSAPGFDSIEIANDLETLPDGSGYVIGGLYAGNLDGEWDAWLIKLDNAGNTVWSKTYTTSNLVGPGEIFVEGEIIDVAVTDTNDFLVIANFFAINSAASERKAYQRALRLDSNGDVIWQALIKTWAAPDPGFNPFVLHDYRAVELRDGSDFFALMESDSTNNQFRVTIMDSAGALDPWGPSFSGTAASQGGLTADSDWGFSVAHNDTGGIYGLKKFKVDGSLLWSRGFGNGSPSQSISAMTRSTDDGYSLVGSSSGPSGGEPLLIKLDAGGALNQ